MPAGRDAYTAYHSFEWYGESKHQRREQLRRIAHLCQRERPDMMDKLILCNRPVREWL